MAPHVDKYPVIIAPSPASKGGISTVIALYHQLGILAGLNAVFLPSYHDGGKIHKLMLALNSIRQLLLLLIRRKVSLVHLHTASYNSFYRKAGYAWLAYVFGVPVIFHVHSGEFVDFINSRKGVARHLVRMTLVRAARIAALSDYWREQFVHATIAPPEKLVVLPNPLPELSVDRKNMQATLDTTRPVILLFLGKLCKNKGIYDLLDALELLIADGCKIRLLCGGNGEVEQFLTSVNEKKLTQHVEFMGWVDEAEKIQAFARCDFFVLPSYFEGQPMTVLEAMAIGVPVIASRAGGIPGLLDMGRLGTLCDVANCQGLAVTIAQCINQYSALCEKAAIAKQEINARHRVATVIAELAALYQEVSDV